MEREFKLMQGMIVKHFKREMSDLAKDPNSFLYKIIATAQHTETGEQLVVYQALYSPFKTFARPYDMFVEKVDKNKYPNINQEYRLEEYKL